MQNKVLYKVFFTNKIKIKMCIKNVSCVFINGEYESFEAVNLTT